MRINRLKLVKSLEERGQTQKEFAEDAHISAVTMSNIMKGKGCNYSTVLKIADTLGVTLEELEEV